MTLENCERLLAHYESKGMKKEAKAMKERLEKKKEKLNYGQKPKR